MATKDFSSVQEKMIADYLGWSVVSGSGAAACHPGDVISDEWLGECKTHVERGHRIFFAANVWKKICDESSVKRRFPVLFTDDGSQKPQKTWCVLPYRCIDETRCCSYKITRGVKVNITFSHDDMIVTYNSFSRNCPEKFTVLTASWNNEQVAIIPLDTFRELFGE